MWNMESERERGKREKREEEKEERRGKGRKGRKSERGRKEAVRAGKTLARNGWSGEGVTE